jgi:uncharacterized protein (TIGR03437 family)
VYAANTGSSSVSVFQIEAGGALVTVPDSPFSAQSQPESIVFDPAGNFAYVANAGSNDISAFKIDRATGSLNQIGNFPAGVTPVALAVDSTGAFLYATNAGSNNTSAYKINANSGMLTLVSTYPAGTTPGSIATITASIPLVTSVDTPGGGTSISQNGWIEIKGKNLAPVSLGTGGMTWSNAPDFASGRMPVSLNNVSVTVNGKSAFVYYISATQLNVLSPLDNTVGAVPIIVTVGGISSMPFISSLQSSSPAFPLLSGTKYIVATHTDNSLVGPPSMSVPGYPFTAAQPGETIVLYAFGFGLPTAPLANGSSTQSGTLPTLPVIQIGAGQGVVTFAGVIGPGLYQFNVTVPIASLSGDNLVICTYKGIASPLGDLLYVHP